MTKILHDLKIGMCAVQEARWPGQGQYKTSGYTLYYSGDDQGRKVLGTGFLVNDKLKCNILNFTPVNKRLCAIRLKGRFQNVSVINCHAPTEESTNEAKEDFYERVDQLFAGLPRYDVKLVTGDFNAKLGKEPAWRPYVGRESLHEVSSDNGILLASFAAAADLYVKSTMFPHRDIHKQTWRSADGVTINQIDHVLVDRRHQSCVTDVRSFRGADGDSDHYLVMYDFRHRMATATRVERRAQTAWNTDKLKDERVKADYQLELANRFALLSVGEDLDEMWSEMKEAISDSATRVLGRRRKRRKVWFNDECQTAVDMRKKALHDYLADGTKKQEYERVRRRANDCLRREKRRYLREKLASIEVNRAANNGRDMYRTIKRMRGMMQQAVTIRDDEGNLLSNPKDALEQWRKYFDGLLNVQPPNLTEEPAVYQTAEPLVDEPTREEVEKAIKMLKNNKAPGIDGLPAELIKQGGERMLTELHNLITNIWRRECIPDEWRESIITPVFKKGDRSDCNNYRGISLLSVGYKVLSNILLFRMNPYAEENLGDYQAGFRRNRSTTDQIFTLRQVYEKCWEFGLEVHNIFVDFAKAYDSILRRKIWEILEEMGVPRKLRAVIRACVEGSRARVKAEGDLSEPFEVVSGVKQGDGLSPLIFNMVLEKIVRATEELPGGVVLGKRVSVLGYADDLDVLAHRMEDAEEVVAVIEREAARVGLRINPNKTKAMTVSREPQQDASSRFENVEEFRYLGSIVTRDNCVSEDVRSRIKAANVAYFQTRTLFSSRVLSWTTKTTLYKTLVRPVLLYGAEAWTLGTWDRSALAVFENKMLRRIFGGRMVNGVWRIRSNAEIHALYNSPDILTFLRAKRLQWVGHVHRMGEDRTARAVWSATPSGRRPIGRPRRRWSDQLAEDLQVAGFQTFNWRRAAADRDRWRTVVREVKGPTGPVAPR